MDDAELHFVAVISTNAGMCALWNPQRFSAVSGLTEWEDAFASHESTEKLIAASSLVPLNVGGDGTFAVDVRSSGLNERERAVLTVTSEPYRITSDGRLQLGGIEQVGAYVGGAHDIPLAAGDYAATVHLIDWQEDPASLAESGEATSDALSDFVVEVRRIEGEGIGTFRTSPLTFERG